MRSFVIFGKCYCVEAFVRRFKGSSACAGILYRRCDVITFVDAAEYVVGPEWKNRI